MNQLISIFQEVLYLGVIASIPCLVILLLKKLFHKVISPRWHYYIWALLILRLLVPFQPESSFSIFNLVYAATERSGFLVEQVGETILYGPNNRTIRAEALPIPKGNLVNSDKEEELSMGSTNQPHTSTKKLSYQAVLALLWLGGVIVIGGFTIYANIAFSIRLRRYYRRLTNSRIEEIFLECKRVLGIKGSISLYTSPITRTPSLYNAIRTRILLSEEHMMKLSDQELRYIFLHELTHYKRKDIVVNWLLMLLQIIYFFQPLLWYAIFKIHEDCEISCDAEVLKYFGEDQHQEYGSTILKLLRLHADSRFIPVTATIGKHKSSYRRRILMIKQFKRYRWTNTIVTLALILAIGLVTLTGCSLKDSDKTAPVTNEDNTESTLTPTPMLPDATDQDQQPDTTDQGEQSDSTDQDQQPDTTDSDENNSIIDSDNHEAVLEESEIDTPSELVPIAEEEPFLISDSEGAGQVNYNGKWIISRVLAFGQGGTYSKEDAEGLIGKEMNFSADKVTCFGDKISDLDNIAKAPTYTATDYSDSDFLSYYRMSFDLLGLSGDKVTEVSARDAQGNGCTFLVKDENTLIVVGGGTYFELTRK